MFWDSVQRGWSRARCSVFLRSFDFFPVHPDLVHVFDFSLSENVRMAANQFLRDVPRDFVEIERAPFLRKLAMKDDLQQQIAKLLLKLVVIAGLNGIEQFINFLDRVPA